MKGISPDFYRLLATYIFACSFLSTAAYGQLPSPYLPDVPGAGEQTNEEYEMQTTIEDGFTMTVVGDLIMAYPPPHGNDPRFQSLVELIQGADVAYANFESHVLNMLTLPHDRFGGFVGPPEVATAVKDMGFDVVGRSNNHSSEFGVEGLLNSDQIIRDAGLVISGSGPDIRWARQPGYFNSAKGRVAFVTASPSFGRAAVSEDNPKTGGTFPLRTTRCTIVSAADEARVRATLDAEECIRIGDVDKPTWSYEMNRADLDAILKSVREGKLRSHFVAVGTHAHQTVYNDTPVTPAGNSGSALDPTVPDFLQAYARASIDAGADAFIGTGPHILRGIEIYKGRPIFYGLGEFFRQMGTIGLGGENPRRVSGILGDPIRYEHVLAVSTFSKGQVSEIRLYPTDLGYGAQFVEYGVPRMASPAVAQKTLKRLQELSAPFGTTITVRGNVGVIRP